tara:strand:- start:1314 stop:2018 length:705 start_codon:yes stop_codon:yes gene_type:complete
MKYKVFTEARMTQRQMGDEATEVLGEPGMPSGVVSGKGYNRKRVHNAIRRAEKFQGGGQKLTAPEQENMSAQGAGRVFGQQLKGKHFARMSKSKIGRFMGKWLLKARAHKQASGRGYKQDIPGMMGTMQTNPDAMPPATKFSVDSRNPYHQQETQIGGRTRNAASHIATGESAPFLTLPSELHADSARRADAFHKSERGQQIFKKLRADGKHPRGQDSRIAQQNPHYPTDANTR